MRCLPACLPAFVLLLGRQAAMRRCRMRWSWAVK